MMKKKEKYELTKDDFAVNKYTGRTVRKDGRAYQQYLKRVKREEEENSSTKKKKKTAPPPRVFV
jgi:hypothetical protein